MLKICFVPVSGLAHKTEQETYAVEMAGGYSDAVTVGTVSHHSLSDSWAVVLHVSDNEAVVEWAEGMAEAFGRATEILARTY